VDFLDLIANGSGDNEIDWTLLNSGYTPRTNEAYTPRAGDLGVGGGTGFTPREGNSPMAVGLEPNLLSNSRHPQRSNVRQSHPADHLLPLLPLPFQDASALAIQDSAETLLKLASHTPHQSPEPESEPEPRDEEKPRPSHLTHQSSDPWPLSYRPDAPGEDLLPSSARGTGYRSRAASPRPGSSNSRPSHVPPVTAATRARVLDKVREIGQAERFVPRLELLDLFVQLYFAQYQVLLPMLHRPTFDPNTCPSFLLLAVASVGARYAHDRVLGASMHAQALMETARTMIQVIVSLPFGLVSGRAEKVKADVTTQQGDVDNTLLRTVAWQQALLIVLNTGHISGNKRDLERTHGGSFRISDAKERELIRKLPFSQRFRRCRLRSRGGRDGSRNPRLMSSTSGRFRSRSGGRGGEIARRSRGLGLERW
jgi:hypothetical protein